MRTPLLALLLLSGAAEAQLTAGNSGATAPGEQGLDRPQVPADPGRYVPNDRDPLTSRGGGTNTYRTYNATIGSTIGGTIGSQIGAPGAQARPR